MGFLGLFIYCMCLKAIPENKCLNLQDKLKWQVSKYHDY